MSTRISSGSMRTIVPSTTSPCLKLLMSASCSARSSSIVEGSGRLTTGAVASSGSSAAGASARSSSVTTTGSGATGAGGAPVSVVAASGISAGSSALATSGGFSEARAATEAVASVSGVVPPVCSSVKICLLWSIVARKSETAQAALKPSVDQQSGGFVRSVHSFDQAMGRQYTCLPKGRVNLAQDPKRQQ